MAYIQKITPPPNRIMNFSLKNFAGGLNNRSDQLEDKEASDLLNMEFVDETLMEKRKGQKYFDELALNEPIVFIDEFRPHNDENVLIRATANHLYIEDTVLTNLNGKPSGVNHEGMYFFADGGKLYVYGVFHQTNTTYRKVVGTPINDYVLLEVVSPAANHPRLDTSHVEGVLTVDYTTFKVFYEPCENEFVDTYKGANVVPDKVKYVVSHNGRIFLSGADKDDHNVFISDYRVNSAGAAFYFPVFMPIGLPPNSDKIVGMAVYDDSVVIGRRNDIHAIFGKTNRPNVGLEPFHLRRINTHTGFANQDAVKIAHNHLFFFGSDGNAYAMGSTRIDEKQMSTSILSKSIDVRKAPINLTLDDVATASSYFHKDMWYVTIKDKVLVYSYRDMAWTLWDGFDAMCFYALNGELIWGRQDGRTATFDEEEYLDFGLPYQAFWYSKHFDMDDANSFKQFREFFIVAHTFEKHHSQIQLLFEIDHADVKDKVVISNEISIWGKSKWGDRFINRLINASEPFVIGRRGRTIRFKFTNGYVIHGEVETYDDLEYYIGRKEGIMVKVIDEGVFYLYTKGSWLIMEEEDLNQRMKIYQVNGDYELRGKR